MLRGFGPISPGKVGRERNFYIPEYESRLGREIEEPVNAAIGGLVDNVRECMSGVDSSPPHVLKREARAMLSKGITYQFLRTRSFREYTKRENGLDEEGAKRRFEELFDHERISRFVNELSNLIWLVGVNDFTSAQNSLWTSDTPAIDTAAPGNRKNGLFSLSTHILFTLSSRCILLIHGDGWRGSIGEKDGFVRRLSQEDIEYCNDQQLTFCERVLYSGAPFCSNEDVGESTA